jgi:hypothetical protein
MATFIFAEKNGNASLTVSADNEDEAFGYLENLGLRLAEWRLDSEEGD